MDAYNRNILVKLFCLEEDEQFQKIYGELLQDEMHCDSCYSISQYQQFIKYRFLQSLIGVEIIGERCLSAKGCSIVLTYNILEQSNTTLDVDITYPVDVSKELRVVDYQNVFWCQPGFFIKDNPIIVVDLQDSEETKYRIKGCLTDTQIEDNLVSYTINVSSCNAIFNKLLDNPEMTANIQIFPSSSVDSFGIYKPGNHFMANKYSI
jgi:hypothetical protein